MISDRYSTARMWALTKRNFVENRRNIAITTGVIFGILLLISIMITKSTRPDHIEWSMSNVEERNIMMCVMFASAAGFIAQILGSLTFSSMSTKPKRISNLMLPASQSEKFISQCLIYVVGGNMFIILSMFLADTISALIFGMAPGWMTSYGLLRMFTDLIHETPYGPQALAMMILGGAVLFLLCQSIYVLGSAWWPRKSFLKTFVALFAIQVALPIIIPFGLLFNFFPEIGRIISDLNITVGQVMVGGWCGLALAYGVLFLIYWLAWQRYKRLAVVKRFL